MSGVPLSVVVQFAEALHQVADRKGGPAADLLREIADKTLGNAVDRAINAALERIVKECTHA